MGLLRGVARTAVVAGTATAVSNRVSRRQAGRWARQEQDQYDEYQRQYGPPQTAPPPAAPAASGMSMEDKMAQLKSLGELRTQGVLTDAEFEQQKAAILAG
jgi:hypothetical protein